MFQILIIVRLITSEPDDITLLIVQTRSLTQQLERGEWEMFRYKCKIGVVGRVGRWGWGIPASSKRIRNFIKQ